ncbi:hypothetical protein BJV82DRAFT_141857 [Fennellomyces sp. T-0311]|nr:hypothetical protein BJV82DRAFT_141857 [Fennellomyces sp. T-0311]
MMLSRLSRQGLVGRNVSAYGRVLSQQRSRSTIDKAKEAADEAAEKAKHIHPTESVKNAGETVNRKVGKGLADGIEMAESATEKAKHVHPVEDLKSGADKVNRKAGEGLAKGIEKAEEVAAKTKEAVGLASKKANKKLDEAERSAEKKIDEAIDKQKKHQQ